MKNTIKVGHDSEAFAFRKGVGYYPMIGSVGGTKEHPLIVPGGNLQEDGMSIEMAVDATASLEEFIHRTSSVRAAMERKVQGMGGSLRVLPSVPFTQKIVGMFLPKSIEQGCDPDYNIYTERENEYLSLQETEYRHGSGHIHVDCPAAVESPEVLRCLVALMDLHIKVPQWLVEGDVPRNTAQGALGNYRPKSYGVEYRSSSNIILTDDAILTHAFNAAVHCSRRATEGYNVANKHLDAVRVCVKGGDREGVMKYLEHYNVELLST